MSLRDYSFKPAPNGGAVDHVKVKLPRAKVIKVSKVGLVCGDREFDRAMVAHVLRDHGEVEEVMPLLFGIASTPYMDFIGGDAFFFGTTIQKLRARDCEMLLVDINDVASWHPADGGIKSDYFGAILFKQLWA